MKHLWIAPALLIAAAAAHADVKVTFVQTDKFSDIKDNSGFRDETVLKDIEAHLVEQAQKRLPGRDVTIEVTDVNLAGDVEPVGHNAQWIRVMRTVTLPSLSMKYTVSEGGKVVKQGETLLRDMNYQDGFNRYSSGDPLRYEKRMIDNWFDREFRAPVTASK
ncbi:DUF3016 domain-containing protein [Roseateles sp. DC23W]|uniref:DUF3016 domain-containing protein n=1 Tax=Pelomonas dachongensis TaxID=3299029 RepID=A0ABW7EKJ5_9BURK